MPTDYKQSFLKASTTSEIKSVLLAFRKDVSLSTASNNNVILSRQLGEALLFKVELVQDDNDATIAFASCFARSANDLWFRNARQENSSRNSNKKNQNLLNSDKLADALTLVLLPRAVERKSLAATNAVLYCISQICQIEVHDEKSFEISGCEHYFMSQQSLAQLFDTFKKIHCTIPPAEPYFAEKEETSEFAKAFLEDIVLNRTVTSWITIVLRKIAAPDDGKVVFLTHAKTFVPLIQQAMHNISSDPASCVELVGDFAGLIGNVAAGRDGSGDCSIIFSQNLQSKKPCDKIPNLLLGQLRAIVQVASSSNINNINNNHNNTTNNANVAIRLPPAGTVRTEAVCEIARSIANISLLPVGQEILATPATARTMRLAIPFCTTSVSVEMLFRAFASLCFEKPDFVSALVRPNPESPGQISTLLAKAVRAVDTDLAVEWVSKGLQNLICMYQSYISFFLVPPGDSSLYDAFRPLTRFAKTRETLEVASATSGALRQMYEISQRIDKNKADINDVFRQGNFAEAARRYGEMIIHLGTHHDGNPATIAPLLTNKALALFKLKRYEESFQDANKACKIDPSWAKGWFRKALVSMELSRYRLALGAFEKYFELIGPETQVDNEVKEQYQEAKQLAEDDDDDSSYDDGC